MIEPKESIKSLFRVPPDNTSRAGKVVRMDKNEHTTPFPQAHFKKILYSISPDEIASYPELEPFYEKLSKWLKVDRNQLLLTSGSDTGIRAVFEVYVEKGDEVVIFPPTYEMYSVYCSMFGAVKKEVFYNDDFSFSLDKALDAINRRTKLVTIANPNHTGTVLKMAELIQIVKAAGDSQAMVLIDEAYHHFYKGTMLSCINKFGNLVIARTFSKAFGVAGLRIGYLISNKDVISLLYKVKLTHEITSVSAKFGEYLLDHLEIMKDYVRDVKEGVKYLSKEFRQLGLIVSNTEANFLYVKLPQAVEPKEMVYLLRERNFHIKGPFLTMPIKGLVRITAGPVGQMRDFVSVFKQIYKHVLG